MSPYSKDEASSLLLEKLTGGQNLPYLFIGSGISRRYLGLPNWIELLRTFSEKANLDFRKELARSERDLPKVATSIAKSFLEIWFDSDEYSEQRTKYSEACGGEEILKVAVAEYLESECFQFENIASSLPELQRNALFEEIELLKNVVVDGIITTNYDRFLDNLFSEFQVFVGQSELLLGHPQFIAEIYKIHGSVDSPESLVLTEQDYEFVDRRNKYLVAKLLTIFAEKPIIFVGYSFSDVYIKKILEDIVVAIGSEGVERLADRIFFVEWDSLNTDLIDVSNEWMILDQIRLPITKIRTADFGWIWSALGQLRRSFPAKILREFKKQIYELVDGTKNSEDLEKVRVIPLEDDDNGAKVIFGIGIYGRETLEEIEKFNSANISSSLLTRDHLLLDALGLYEGDLDPKMVLSAGVESHLRATKRMHIPVHKYLAELGYLDSFGQVKEEAEVSELVRNLAEIPICGTEEYRRQFSRAFPKGCNDVDVIWAKKNKVADSTKYQFLLALDQKNVDLQKFREFLVQRVECDLPGKNGGSKLNTSFFAKAVTLYSRLAWESYLQG